MIEDWLLEFADIIEVVDEPDYSKSIIEEMEKKYSVTSDNFYKAYKNDVLNYKNFDRDDIDKWIHHIEVLQILEGEGRGEATVPHNLKVKEGL